MSEFLLMWDEIAPHARIRWRRVKVMSCNVSLMANFLTFFEIALKGILTGMK